MPAGDDPLQYGVSRLNITPGLASSPGERRKNPYLRRKHDEITGALSSPEDDRLKVLLDSVRAADLAEMIQRFSPEDQARVLLNLDLRRGALVMKRARAAVAADITAALPLDRAADLLDWMAVDDRASVLELIQPPLRDQLLHEMELRTAEEVRQALAWPEKTAGRMIYTHAVRLADDLTVAGALEKMRELDTKVEKLNDGYVLDGRGVLIGVVSLRQLVTGAPDRLLRDIMATDIVSVRPTDDQEVVAQAFAKYDFLSLPVVSHEGIFLGIITIDDILDILYREHAEDILHMGGIHGDSVGQETYFSLGTRQAVRSRIGWLLLLFAAETCTGVVLRHFESELGKVVALSFFIPLMIGTGGNAGSQTVATVIRGLALGELRSEDWFRVLRKEATTGLTIGVILGTVGFFRAMLWGVGSHVSLAVSFSLLAICTWSTAVGALVPLAANRAGVDPTVVSAPLITTLVDATGLFIYLKVASVILGIH